jgi:hypothetical protein
MQGDDDEAFDEDEWEVDDGAKRPADPPEGGWPWQCDLCDVWATRKRNGNKLHKASCKLCSWGPDVPGQGQETFR